MGYSNIGSGSGGGGGVVFYNQEFPPATLGQTVFTLSGTPTINSQLVMVNGLPAYPGISNDYTISSNMITFNYGLELNDEVMVGYSQNI